MGAYLQLFWDLCRWRRGPADVPNSTSLFLLLALLYWLCSVLQGRIANGPENFIGPATLDLVVTLGFFALVFGLTGRRHRFRQAVGAVLGVSILLTPPVLLLLAVQDPAALPTGFDALRRVATFALFGWYLVIVGSIMRAALDCGIVAAMGISIAYFVTSALLITSIYPPGA